MNPNHKPATPLPFASEHQDISYTGAEGHFVTARNSEDLIADVWLLNGLNAEQCKQNAAYIAHAANAYPKLVRALEDAYDALVTYGYEKEDRGVRALALLRELGEAA